MVRALMAVIVLLASCAKCKECTTTITTTTSNGYKKTDTQTMTVCDRQEIKQMEENDMVYSTGSVTSKGSTVCR